MKLMKLTWTTKPTRGDEEADDEAEEVDEDKKKEKTSLAEASAVDDAWADISVGDD